MSKYTRVDFISAATSVHGDSYDYDNVEYKTAHDKVEIQCNGCDSIFKQTPANHIHKKAGCPKCGSSSNAAKLNLGLKVFKQKAREIHGTKYSYHKTIYVSLKKKVIIHCMNCKMDFHQQAGSHLKGRGCPICAKTKVSICMRSTSSKFILKARKLHGDQYDYSKVAYTTCRSPVHITCRRCLQSFMQAPNKHLTSKGCTQCKKENARKHRALNFIAKSKHRHGSLYKYDKVDYINNWTLVTLDCVKCKTEFSIKPHDHIRGLGCKVCTYKTPGYSKMAIAWLEHESKTRRIKIQHAENGGEYRVPGTPFKVDGFNKRSNTIFEFHGDRFHGNPEVYSPRSKPNPFSSNTARKLHQKTKEREELLMSLGYNLIVMWEKDWLA